MAYPAGAFVWYDLMTTDTAAAEAFYGSVIGWQMRDNLVNALPYRVLCAGDASIGGMMALSPEKIRHGVQPGWLGYIAVADVDAVAAQISAAGGTVHHGPDDIPGIGRFATVADPQGAVFIVFKGSTSARPEPAAPGTPGHIGWHELHARDWEPAFAFYAKLFGWTKTMTVDMGPMGTYQTFATGGEAVGGMMTLANTASPPGWLYYVNVAAIDAAAARVIGGGGQILNGPHPVPGGSWIVQGRDPQGAHFALVSARR